jgi:hypothetical protein
LNTSPLGYIPVYQYVTKRHAFQVPTNDNLNLFYAMAMVYAVINKDHKQGIYGDTNFQKAMTAIFKIEANKGPVGFSTFGYRM